MRNGCRAVSTKYGLIKAEHFAYGTRIAWQGSRKIGRPTDTKMCHLVDVGDAAAS